MILFGGSSVSLTITSAKGEPVMPAMSRVILPHPLILNAIALVSVKSSQCLGATLSDFASAVITVELPEICYICLLVIQCICLILYNVLSFVYSAQRPAVK